MPQDPRFAKMKPEYIKSLILLAAQVGRAAASVPEGLQEDFQGAVATGARLLDELLKMTLRPRPPYGYPWMRPTLSVLEYSQHFVQAVPLSARSDKPGAVGGADGPLTLLQLPHVDAEVSKQLGRKKVKGLADLVAAEPAERTALLEGVRFPVATAPATARSSERREAAGRSAALLFSGGSVPAPVDPRSLIPHHPCFTAPVCAGGPFGAAGPGRAGVRRGRARHHPLREAGCALGPRRLSTAPPTLATGCLSLFAFRFTPATPRRTSSALHAVQKRPPNFRS